MLVVLKQELFLIIVFTITCTAGIRTYSKNDLIKLRLGNQNFSVHKLICVIFCREEVKDMFYHAYDSYLKYAYPYDELRPISCDGIDTYGR